MESKVFGFFKKFMIMFVFIFIVGGFSACDDKYQDLTLTLSNNNEEITLYLGENGVSNESVVEAVVGGGDDVDKRVNVSVDGDDYVSIQTEFNGKQSTFITISANNVCRREITVRTLEGSKIQRFYVNVINPVRSITPAEDSTIPYKFYAIRDSQTKLIATNLLNFTPRDTSQKEIDFSLVTPVATAAINNNILYVAPDYPHSTIEIRATSKYDLTVQTTFELKVINKLSDTALTFGAVYNNTEGEIDLTKQIQLANNEAAKKQVRFTITVDTVGVSLSPYIKSTASSISDALMFSTVNKIESLTSTTFECVLSSADIRTEDEVYFIVKYDNFEYSYQTKSFSVCTYDAISELVFFVNDERTGANKLTVYDKYIGTYGLKVLTSALPTTISDFERQLVLEKSTGANNFTFYDKNGQMIVFEGNVYNFTSGDVFYVKANTFNLATNGKIKVYSASNPAISKEFELVAAAGADSIIYTNPATDPLLQSRELYYLSNNAAYEQIITFTIDTDDIATLRIHSTGSSYVIDDYITPSTTGRLHEYQFKITSIKNAPEESSILTIEQANGCRADITVEVFKELEQNTISFSAPTAQSSTSVGEMLSIDYLKNIYDNARDLNLEFSVSIKNNNAVSLTKQLSGVTSVEYAFYDFLIEDAASRSTYDGFLETSLYEGIQFLEYSNDSVILNKLFLTSYDQIMGMAVGKTWVRAGVSGYYLSQNNGVFAKQKVDYYYYFLVEIYNPITSFALSSNVINLYSKNSVNYEEYSSTMGSISLNINKNATYQNFVWSSARTAAEITSREDYYVNGQQIYSFENMGDYVRISAFSTLQPYDNLGQIIYKEVPSLTYYFVAQVVEFGTTYVVELKVNITHAQQVEKILVSNVNVSAGIYIPLTYDGKTINRQITAVTQIGESGVEAKNNNLVYEFLPDGDTNANILKLDKNTGLITISGELITGGTGVIRIVPADRYIASGVYQNADDVLVEIKIVIADGRSRGTSYQINSVQEITNFVINVSDVNRKYSLHYTLMRNDTITQTICETFDGGLYGAMENDTNLASITTSVPLFGKLTEDAVVQDLIIQGNISGTSSVAAINQGLVKNVSVEVLTTGGNYAPSTIIAGGGSEFVGGIVAQNSGTVENCGFYGQISAIYGANVRVGGIVGQNSGTVSGCKVEFYNFSQTVYGKVQGGAQSVIGGIVGENTSGSITNSSVYSFVQQVNESQEVNYDFNVITAGGGSSIGVIAGTISGGLVDECFGYANVLRNIIGQSYTGEKVNNAFALYRENNQEQLLTNYTYYGTKNYDFNQITADEVWAKDLGVLGGLPYFANSEIVNPLLTIPESFANLEGVIEGVKEAILFFYNTEATLSSQEKIALDRLNFFSFENLFSAVSSLGIRAISSNENVIQTSANGISATGVGFSNVKFFSKYDYSTAKEYALYVIYPIQNFGLSSSNIAFNNGATIDVKITDGFMFNASTDNTVVLEQFSREYITNDIKLLFYVEINELDYSSLITGNSMGPFTVSTASLAIYSNSVNIDFSVDVGISSLESVLGFVNLLNQEFGGTFKLNLYRGADSVELSTSKIEVEPIDETVLDVYVYGDEVYQDDQNNIKEDVLTIINSNTNAPSDLFVIQTEYVDSVYYDSKEMFSTVAQESEANYFKHHFTLNIQINDKYKDRNFANTYFEIYVYAKSSQDNLIYSNTNLVGQVLMVTITSQNLLSITVNHKSISNKSLEYDAETQTNIVCYEYYNNATGVIAPGDEGLLEINLYPNYARFDEIRITYTTINGLNYNLDLGLMIKRNDGKFYPSAENCEYITNGIKIKNNYSYSEENFSPLSTLYISTYLSFLVDQDTVFVITIASLRDGKVLAENTYNLIAQYVTGAEIKVQDDAGNKVVAMAKGTTKNLLITIQKNQTLNLESIVFNGLEPTSNMGQNYISYSSFQVVSDLYSSTITYKASLYVGRDVQIVNNANYITIEATITWVVNGKLQQKTSSYTLGIVDFMIEEINLMGETIIDNNLVGYIGVQTNLNFDFGNNNLSDNASFNKFLQNYYYVSASRNNDYGDYKVNVNSNSPTSFLGNLYYVNGNARTPVLNSDGSIEENSYFSIVVENGVIKIIGKRSTTSAVNMCFVLPVKYPSKTETIIQEIVYNFTISITTYSDEDTPRIIDNETTFLDAVKSANPQNYILMSDLYLYDYAPISTTGLASLDGNNFTINIMSWSITGSGSISLALFNEITENTTLKNVTVNLYHATNISLNTSVFSTINVAGFAITNNGIIYNCSVVAYKADLTKANITNPGININYLEGQITNKISSQVAGMVITNNGYITNSRVGGESIYKVRTGTQLLETFAISAQGDISGFVINNSKYITSSYFANGTIKNNTISLDTSTSGFVRSNTGQINASYVKGTGQVGYSYMGDGISTSSISAGFVYSNSGSIGDCYSNILLATTTINQEYESGRLSAGFVYTNLGVIERCYTASKIQDAKSTQMAFVGVNAQEDLLNTGRITYSYYYSPESIQGDAYANTTSSVNIVRITYPENSESYYGFSFADDASSINGVWYATNNGVELVSANQIAISSRYIANEKRDENGTLISYNLPYVSGYEYGSKKNPIIIRSASEFNLVFGGDDIHAGSAISKYYNLANKTVFGNYRLITNINLLDLSTDSSTGVKVNTTTITLDGGVLDGNMLTISGIGLTSPNNEKTSNSFGLFNKMTNGAVIMNVNAVINSVSAIQVKYVGGIVGQVQDSKLININVSNANGTQASLISGYNIVGGLAGVVQGASEVKNISVSNIDITTHYMAVTEQQFNRNINEVPTANSTVSYAGGLIGVADVYDITNKENTYHVTGLTKPSLSNLIVKGAMQIRASTVGGVIGYLGPQTLMKDSTLEISSSDRDQKLIAYNYYAGGIVGECFGDIDMARAEHDEETQKIIENNISNYYQNPQEPIARGNLNLFEASSSEGQTSSYQPIAIGGIVGNLQAGNIKHSYSKINVRNSNAYYAGGVIGLVPYIAGFDRERNAITLYEVYAFGDVYALQTNGGAGGIVGYIHSARILTFTKVNAVNYYSVVYNPESKTYALPSNIYQIFAKTGSSTDYKNSEYVGNMATYENNIASMKTGYSESQLPIISTVLGSSYMCAVNTVKVIEGTIAKTLTVNKSYARLSTNSVYNMIYDTKQIITPFFDLDVPEYNGSEMDTYFDTWDSNFWIRYTKTNDLLPSLVTFSESNIYYIDVASDIQYMVYYPNATFIVRANNKAPYTVNVGNYLKETGLKLTNFTGTLKGYDDTTKYGLDFDGYYSFIENTSNAKFYNLTIKRIGYEIGEQKNHTEITTAFIDNAIATSFENLLFENCQVYGSASDNNNSFGIMVNNLTGGYVSNVSFDSCYMNIKANANIEELNVGMLAGTAETLNNSYVQIFDVCQYQSHVSSFNNNIENEINSVVINTNNKLINNLNVGGVAGITKGSVLAGYSSESYNADTNEVKGVGIISTTKNPFTSTTTSAVNEAGTTGQGLILALTESGTVTNYNAGLLYGKVNTMNLSSSRSNSYQKLYVVGAITQSTLQGMAIVQNANLGGMIGNVESSITLANTASQTMTEAFVEVNADIKFRALQVNAGMLLGKSANTNSIDNIDGYGTINVATTTETVSDITKAYSSNIGGFVGCANGEISITNAVSYTIATLKEDNVATLNNVSSMGGFIGYFNSSSANLKIGNANYDTEFAGNLYYDGNRQVAMGGLVGALSSASGGALQSATIKGSVFSGNINIINSKEVYAGGIIGLTTESTAVSGKLTYLYDNISYGDIYLSCNVDGNENTSYVGGVIGKGSRSTIIQRNYSIASIISQAPQTSNKLVVNAIAGLASGTTNGTAPDATTPIANYYSHQLTLCLDSNLINNEQGTSPFDAQNIYYKNQELSESGLPTINEVLKGYRDIMKERYTQNYINNYFSGNKIYPIEIQTRADYSKISNSTTTKKYFLLVNDTNVDEFYIENLNSCHILGDGYAVWSKSKAAFGVIGENSVVSGLRISAEINTSNSSTSLSLSGTGALANINHGVIYSCSVVEQKPLSTQKTYGLNSTSGVNTGAVVGVNFGQILDTMSGIDVVGTGAASGFVGYNSGLISSCFATGAVESTTSYAFCNGSTESRIYYSYTASPTTNAKGIFASTTQPKEIVECYADLYAVGTDDNATTFISDTKTMSKELGTNAVKENFLLSHKRDTGLSEHSENTIKMKFGYDATQNFGYLSFSGIAYKNFSYLQNLSSGDGSKANPILINSVGRLQQINLSCISENTYSYQVIANLEITDLLIEAYNRKNTNELNIIDTSFKVVDWKSIGGGSGNNVFAGFFDGGNAKDAQIKNVYNRLWDKNENALFGDITAAEIKFTSVVFDGIDSTEFASRTSTFSGLALNAVSSKIDNVDVNFGNITSSTINKLAGILVSGNGSQTVNSITNSEVVFGTINTTSSDLKFGGIIAEDSASTITDTTVSEIVLTATSASLIGGVVSESTLTNISKVNVGASSFNISSGTPTIGNVIAKGNGNISEVTVANLSITSESIDGAVFGGVIGEVYGEKAELSDVQTSGLTVNLAGASTSVIGGGVIGKGNSVLEDITVGNVAITSQTDASSYIGGAIGQGDAEIDSIKTGSVTITSSSTGSASFGGLVGKTAELDLSGTNTLSSAIITISAAEEGSQASLGGVVGDGAGEISNLTVNGNINLTNKSAKNAKLGGVAGNANDLDVDSSVELKNINIVVEGEHVKGSSNLGGVFGSSTNSDIGKLTVGDIDIQNKTNTKNYMGGLVGTLSAGEIDVDIQKGKITLANTTEEDAEHDEESSIGGFVGKAIALTLKGSTFSYSNITMAHNGTGTSLVGGVAGSLSSGTISNITIQNIELPGDGEAELYYDNAGGIAGAMTNVALSQVVVSNIKIESNPYKEQKENFVSSMVGGVAGTMTDCLSVSDLTLRTIEILGEEYSEVGGVAGVMSNSSISNIKTEESLKVKISIDKSISTETAGNAGGIAGTMQSTNILGSQFNATVGIDGTGYAGGVAGVVSGSETKVSGSTITVAVTDTKSYITASSPDNSLAIGGLFGKSENSGLIIESSTISGAVTGTNMAGGLIGIGKFKTIGGEAEENKVVCNVAVKAGITPDDELLGTGEGEGEEPTYEDSRFHSSTTPYAGGIIAYMQSGTMNYVENTGKVEAGWNKPIEDYGDTSDPETGETIANNSKLSKTMLTKPEILDGYSAESEGSETSYAGGIAAYVAGGESISNVSNSASVTAKAKFSLTVEPCYQYEGRFYVLPFLPGLGGAGTVITAVMNLYNGYCYYAYQYEEAYASGLVYEQSTTSILANACTLKASAEVIGGGKIGFNMFASDIVNADFWYLDSYILDYGSVYDSELGDYRTYNSFSMYIDDITKDIIGPFQAWKKAIANGVKPVAANSSKFEAFEEYYSWSESNGMVLPGDEIPADAVVWGETEITIDGISIKDNASEYDVKYKQVYRVMEGYLIPIYGDNPVLPDVTLPGAATDFYRVPEQLLGYTEITRSIEVPVYEQQPIYGDEILTDENGDPILDENGDEQYVITGYEQVLVGTDFVEVVFVALQGKAYDSNATSDNVYDAYYILSNNCADERITQEMLDESISGLILMNGEVKATPLKVKVKQSNETYIPVDESFFKDIYSYSLSNAQYGSVSVKERVYNHNRTSWIGELSGKTVDSYFTVFRNTSLEGNGQCETKTTAGGCVTTKPNADITTPNVEVPAD